MNSFTQKNKAKVEAIPLCAVRYWIWSGGWCSFLFLKQRIFYASANHCCCCCCCCWCCCAAAAAAAAVVVVVVVFLLLLLLCAGLAGCTDALEGHWKLWIQGGSYRASLLVLQCSNCLIDIDVDCSMVDQCCPCLLLLSVFTCMSITFFFLWHEHVHTVPFMYVMATNNVIVTSSRLKKLTMYCHRWRSLVIPMAS